jgi:CHAD domain-containing protein
LDQLERTSEHVTEDAVHDLRVCLRRLSEATRNAPHTRKLRKCLRRIRRHAAAVRDRDITLRLLRHFHLPSGDPALYYLQGQRDLAAQQLRRFLQRQRLPPIPLEKGTPHDVVPLIEAFFLAGYSADDAHGLHALRIAAKRLRYALEWQAAPGAEKWLAGLRLIQRQLGDMHDALVAAELLESLPRFSPAARKLPSQFRTKAAAHQQAFANTWKRRFGKRTEQAWLTWARKGA